MKPEYPISSRQRSIAIDMIINLTYWRIYHNIHDDNLNNKILEFSNLLAEYFHIPIKCIDEDNHLPR